MGTSGKRWLILSASILNFVNSAGSLIGVFFAYSFLSTFVLLALAEGAVVLLVAGSLDLSSSVFYSKVREYVYQSKEKYSVTTHRQAQMRANRYIALGASMVVESLLISLALV